MNHMCVDWWADPTFSFFPLSRSFFIYLFLSYKLENVDNRCNTIIFKIMYSFLSREKNRSRVVYIKTRQLDLAYQARVVLLAQIFVSL